jgi:hypothetical protein
MPAVGTEVRLYFYGIPAEQRRRPVHPGKRHYRSNVLFGGCLEIPVHGEAESAGASGSRSAKTASMTFLGCFHAPKRSHIGPFPGWLSAEVPLYPSSENLKTRVHLRDDGVRPYIELEPTDHPACCPAAKRDHGRSRSRNLRLLRAYPERRTKQKRRLPKETAFCLIVTCKEEFLCPWQAWQRPTLPGLKP